MGSDSQGSPKKGVLVAVAAALLLVGSAIAMVVWLSAEGGEVVVIAPPAQTPSAGGAQPPTGGASPQTGQLPAWQERFQAVYRLDEGEVARFIPAPYIPEREQYFRAFWPHKDEDPGQLAVEWDGAAPRIRRNSHGGADVHSAIFGMVDMSFFDFRIPPRLADLPLKGDWVYRKGASRDERISALEQVIWDRLHRRIRFEKRMEKRMAIVARGTYEHQAAVPGHNPRWIHLFTDDRLDPDNSVSGGTKTIADFLASMGEHYGYPAVDETSSSSMPAIWAYHSSGAAMGGRQEPLERVNKILQNVAKQTSLNIRTEERELPVWLGYEEQAAAVDGGAAPSPPLDATTDTGQAVTVRIAKIAELRVRYPSPADQAAEQEDTRTHEPPADGPQEASMRLSLRLGGPAAQGAQRFHVTVTEAVDDAGTNITPARNDEPHGLTAAMFYEIEQPAPDARGDAERADTIPVEVDLNSPVRKATRITRIKGTVHLLVGGRTRVVSVSKLASRVGQTLDSTTLKEAGAQMQIVDLRSVKEKPTASELSIAITGNRFAVDSMDILDRNGESLIQGRYAPQTKDASQTWNYVLERPIDDAMTLKVWVNVGQKAVTVPLDLKDVALP